MNKGVRILVADKFPEEGILALAALGAEVSVNASLVGEALTEALNVEDPEILIVRGTKVTAADLAAAPSLGLVVRAGAGVNSIDIAAASRRGVYVANCPGKNSVAVAELAFAHLLALDRSLVDGALDLRQGRWNKKRFSQARGVLGRRLGLLGVGGIGVEMIPRAHAFGMTVVAWSRSLTPGRAEALDIDYAVSPREVAERCDVLSIHLALTEETRGLVGREVLDALPDGALVINTSRGEVLDEVALAEAMERKGLRVGLDVFVGEPAGGEGTLDPGLFALEGSQGTHHIGASTDQAQQAVADEVIRIVRTYVAEGAVPNCVNLADRTPATHLLVVRHADRVGVLASILQCIRGADLNVQEMENQIFAGGGAACARIHLAGEPDEVLLASVRGLDHVLAASVANLAGGASDS
jgi:D-3-phosphoglycerate dehydrogenase